MRYVSLLAVQLCFPCPSLRVACLTKSFTSIFELALRLGHLCAMVALLTTIDAAMRASTSALPIHAVVLLFCSVPLRTILAFTAHSVQEPAVQSGASPLIFTSYLASAILLGVARVLTRSLRCSCIICLGPVFLLFLWCFRNGASSKCSSFIRFQRYARSSNAVSSCLALAPCSRNS